MRHRVRALATEQKRDVHQPYDHDAPSGVEEVGGCGETAVPRGARANRRPKFCGEGAGSPLS